VLEVIAVDFDLQTVLNTLSETAARLCAAGAVVHIAREGEPSRFVTAVGSTPETTRDALRITGLFSIAIPHAGPRFDGGRVVAERRSFRCYVAADPEYRITEANTIAKIRTCSGVPIMREGSVIGTMTLGRQRVEPFTERDWADEDFADQAVSQWKTLAC